jgi:hypothetical protein
MTQNATVQCAHGTPGQSTPLVQPAKWLVNDGAVLLENDTGDFPLCVFNPPCKKYILKSMGLNATTVDGRRVILVTDFQQSVTALPMTITETHQVYDDTSPAGLTDGGPPPPADPEMTDLIAPVVVAAPPALAYNIATMSPAPLPVTFSLTSAHPMQWVLTFLNGVGSTSEDATNGLPTGLVPAPPGGAWTTPQLVVAVMLMSSFFASAGQGLHHLYMTGVSKRGLSGFAEVKINVT